jgi:hypothetical protein
VKPNKTETRQEPKPLSVGDQVKIGAKSYKVSMINGTKARLVNDSGTAWDRDIEQVSAMVKAA